MLSAQFQIMRQGRAPRALSNVRPGRRNSVTSIIRVSLIPVSITTYTFAVQAAVSHPVMTMISEANHRVGSQLHAAHELETMYMWAAFIAKKDICKAYDSQ